jgi:hypothetical protein
MFDVWPLPGIELVVTHRFSPTRICELLASRLQFNQGEQI